MNETNNTTVSRFLRKMGNDERIYSLVVNGFTVAISTPKQILDTMAFAYLRNLELLEVIEIGETVVLRAR